MHARKLYLLGTPRIEEDGKPLSISRRKTVALLAYLAATNQPHNRDFLATLFWPDYDQAGARANLRRDLSRLKNALGADALLVDRSQASIHPDADWELDVATFQAAADLVREHNHFPEKTCPECLAACTEAVALYTADFMVGFSLPDCPEFDDWQFFQADGLRQTLAELLHHLLQWHTRQGEYERAIEYGRRWLVLDTLHEEAHRQLMRLYAWSGQHAAALRQYDECVRILEEELGVEPEPETSELHDQIRARRLEMPTVVPDSETAVSSPTPTTPSQRYIIQEQFDAGGHSDVYLGKDRVSGETIVIKRIKPELMVKDEDILARFQQEGTILRQLNHPNIVRMLDMYEQDGEQHLVMEYVPGGTLRQHLDAAAQPLSVADTVAIVLELADALSRAHHLGVIHRDLKPENVLLAEDGTPRLTDFGVARLEKTDARLTQTGVLLGSPAYMSPESLQEGKRVDARSDVWSFGVLLYEMLAGQPPFSSDQLTSTIVHILNEPTPDIKKIRPDLPQALADLVHLMLVKQPAKRMASMRQVAAALEAIRDGRSPQFAQLTPVPGQNLGAAVTPLPRLPDIPNNLPVQPTLFVGRTETLNRIQQLLLEEHACRLLTLVGPGGVGKTRLALETGRHLLEQYPDGVYVVSLAGVSGPEFIVPALAEILPMQFSGAATPKAQLIHFLRPKQMLLVLDNFEHLLAGTELLADILRLAPCVNFLVTSRERLRLQEEWSLEIGGLSSPAADKVLTETRLATYEAVQLFSQRIRRADASFSLSAENVTAVTRICSLLEGNPLALELVAPQIRQRSCATIMTEIEQTLSSDQVEADQQVRTVLAQIWENLPAAQQKVLCRLSVFLGGCQREAAETIADTKLPVLAALVDKAIVRQDENGRFSLHELVRQFVREKCQEDVAAAEDALDAHSSYYLEFLARRTANIKGDKQSIILHEISIDLDNIRAAWRRGVARRQLTSLLAAAECYWLFSEFRGILHEGENAFRYALDQLASMAGKDDIATMLLGYLRAGQGSLMARRGWLVEGVPQIEIGLHSLQQPVIPNMQKVAFVQMWLAFALVRQGRFEEASRHAQESLTYFPETYDYWTKAGGLRLLGTASLFQGNLEQAEALFNDCLNTCAKIGEQRIQTYARADLGVIAMLHGDYGRSQQWFDEAMELSRQSGDRLSRVQLLRDQGILAIQQGRYERASDLLAQSKATSEEVGRPVAGKITCAQGVIHYRQGNGLEAKAHFQNGLAAAKAVGNSTGVADCLQQLALLTADEGRPDHAEQLLQDAHAIWQDIDNEPMMALVECSLGHVIARTDASRSPEVRQHFQYALATALVYGLAPIALEAIVGLSAWRLKAGETELAAAVPVGPSLAFVAKHPASTIITREHANDLLKTVPDAQIAEQNGQETLTDWHKLAETWLVALKTAENMSGSVGNMPPSSSPFVGRDNELAALQTSLLQDKARLVTIVGPGGIGKTRLSIATAEMVAPHFIHGVHYVPLTPLESAENLLTAVAEAVNFHITPTEDPVQQLLDYLKNKHMLLVFDNFEHLLPRTDLIERILTNVPEAQILVTSRKRLNVGSEVVYPLGGLAFPKSMPASTQELLNYGAVALFLLHVETMQAAPELKPSDKAALVRICQMVQGMPLALILAAGWSDMLSFMEIAEEINASLDFLESERHDLPKRQRSMRAVFDGSWQQLAPDVQQAFARLSIFRSGFTRQAAQVVAKANLRTLRRLVNNSFISVRENGRYQIHELMRQYGEEHLHASGQFEEVRSAHSAFYLSFLAEREQDLKGRRQEEALAEIDAEFENILSAWNWSCKQLDREGIGQAVETVHLFCDLFGRYREGTALLEQARNSFAPPSDTDPDLIYARILTRHAFMQVFFPTKWEEALLELQQALSILENQEDKAELALNHLAQGSFVFTTEQDPEVSRGHHEQAAALFTELGDDFYLGRTLISTSFCYAVLGKLKESLKVVEDGLVYVKRSGSKADLALGLTNLGEHALGMGNYDLAEAHFREAIDSATFVNNAVILSYCRSLLSLILWLKGDLEDAKQLMKQSLKMAEDMNHAITVAYAQSVISLWAGMTEEHTSARHWAQAGYDNPANNTIGLVIAQMGLAIVCCNQGRWDEARQALHVALNEAAVTNYPAPPLWLLPITAVLVAKKGKCEKAVELLALASNHALNETGWMVHWQVLADVQAQLGAELSLGEYGAAWVRGEALLAEVDGETAVAFVRSQLEEIEE